MKIAHISDVHIKNTKEHEAYNLVFDKLYASLKEKEVDLIVVTGDIAHSKTQLSPEYVSIATDFIKNLSDITDVIIIPGNHDGNLKNLDRLDAIEPLMSSQDKSKVHYDRNSYSRDIGKYTFHHLSIFDRLHWPSNVDPKQINIALYHGCISGAKPDLGHSLEGENDVSIFKMYDYGLLGDIHKANQVMDKHGKVRYAGSLIQQNFGEEEEKGYLIWDISGKKKFSVEFVRLENDFAYISIPVNELGKERKYSPNNNVRIIADKFYNNEQVKKIVNEFKDKNKVENIYFLNSQKSNNTDLQISKSVTNIKDSQDEILAEYLLLNDISEEVTKKIIELNKQYGGSARKHEFDRWTVEDLKFDNMFNYGLGNSVDFVANTGIVGIFGKSFTGKSSIIDTLMFSIFGKTSKDLTKNSHIINVNREYANTEVCISANGSKYYIERFCQRTKDSAKNSLEFYKVTDGVKHTLNGDSLHETEKNIQELFGDDADFMLTSLASQHGSLKFITEKSTDRKRILSKFLDIDFLETKYKEANKTFSDTKGALSYMRSRMVEVTEQEEQELTSLISRVEEIEAQVNSTLVDKVNLENKIRDLQANQNLHVETKSDIKEKITTLDSKISDLQSRHNKLQESINESVEKVNRSKEVIRATDELNLQQKINMYNSQSSYRQSLQESIDLAKKTYSEYKKSKENRSPCQSNYDHCKLAKDAFDFIQSFDQSKFLENINDLSQKMVVVDKELSELPDLETMKDKLKTRDSLVDMIKVIDGSLKSDMANLDYLSKQLEELQMDREALEAKMNSVVGGEDKEALKGQLEALQSDLSILLERERVLLDEKASSTTKINIIRSKIEKQIEEAKEIEELREKYDLYQIYKDAMHPNGLQSYVITQKIPEINNQIASILSNIVNFNVYIEYNDPKLDIMIQHPNEEPRVIESASGAEKSLASFAIRFALINVTNLPKSDLLIMDEPASEFDDDIKASFESMLNTIRQWFKTILIISHIDSIKDVVDQEIVIENKNGFAQVVV